MLLSAIYGVLSGQERKFIASMRAICGYKKRGISSRIQKRSSGNQRFRVWEVSMRLPRVSSMLKEVGILPTLVYFPFFGLEMVGCSSSCHASFT